MWSLLLSWLVPCPWKKYCQLCALEDIVGCFGFEIWKSFQFSCGPDAARCLSKEGGEGKDVVL